MGEENGEAIGVTRADAMANVVDGLMKMREEFPPEAISKLPKGGTDLDFVGHANITDRLLSADLLWNWEPLAWDEKGLPLFVVDQAGKPKGLWIKLTVKGVTRLGYGSVMPGKQEAEKELIGDALRNASMRFGAALSLWSKSELESVATAPEPVDVEPILKGFRKYNVTMSMIERRLGKPLKNITQEEADSLLEIGIALRNGAKVSDYFQAVEVALPEVTNGAVPANPRATVESSIQPKKKAA